MNTYYSTFDTPIGICAIAWRQSGESGVATVLWFQLPGATADLTGARIAEKSGARQSDAPPPQIAALLENVRKHLAGEVQDFRGVPVDLSAAAPFARQVLEATRQIPSGRTITYGELARSIGRPDAARRGPDHGQQSGPTDHSLPSSGRRRRQVWRLLCARWPSHQGRSFRHRTRRFRAALQPARPLTAPQTHGPSFSAGRPNIVRSLVI